MRMHGATLLANARLISNRLGAEAPFAKKFVSIRKIGPNRPLRSAAFTASRLLGQIVSSGTLTSANDHSRRNGSASDDCLGIAGIVAFGP